MSTKAIRRALQALVDTQDMGIGGLGLEALAEVEAIERAVRTVAEQGIYLEEEPSALTVALVEAAEAVFERIAEETAP